MWLLHMIYDDIIRIIMMMIIIIIIIIYIYNTIIYIIYIYIYTHIYISLHRVHPVSSAQIRGLSTSNFAKRCMDAG